MKICKFNRIEKGLIGVVFTAIVLLGGITQTTKAQNDPQPAILGTTSVSRSAVVFPDASSNPNNQILVPGLPENSSPHGVAYFGSDNALISDFGNNRIFVIRVSTGTILSTINTGAYNGSGSIAVSPDLKTALAIGSTTTLHVIRAPFNETSEMTTLNLTNGVDSYQTQAIIFDNTGRAFINQRNGISVVDPPYTSVTFTMPHAEVYAATGGIAITPDGSQLLVTKFAYGDKVLVYNAPFSASSTYQEIPVPGLMAPSFWGATGIMVAPDGNTAIVVSGGLRAAAFVRAPFTSSSVVELIPLPANGGSSTFEDVGISADSQTALITGNALTSPEDHVVMVKAPFTAAETETSLIPILNVTNPARGAGAVRFMPPGLAPGLTVTKNANPSVESGTDLTYTITYGNTGSANAASAVITDPLPAGTTFVSATNGGALVDGNVVFNVGTIAAGSTGNTVSFTVNVTASAGQTVNNNNYTIAAAGVTSVFGTPVTTVVVETGSGFVSVGGRITAANGRGVPNVYLNITDGNGMNRVAVTNTFGYYRFDQLTPGVTYQVQPKSRLVQFIVQSVTPKSNVTDLNFQPMALPLSTGNRTHNGLIDK